MGNSITQKLKYRKSVIKFSFCFIFLKKSTYIVTYKFNLKNSGELENNNFKKILKYIL